AIWAIVYVIALLLLISNIGTVAWLRYCDYALMELVFLAFASSLWSVNPVLSLRRSIAVIGTSIVGIYLANRYDLRELLLMLSSVTATIVVLSFSLALLVPKYGIDPSTGSHWRGAFGQKNILGRMMVLTVVVWFIIAADRRRNRPMAVVIIMSSVGLVLLSSSKTSLLALIALVIPLIAIRLLRRSGAATFIAAAWIGAILPIMVTWFSLNADRVYKLL